MRLGELLVESGELSPAQVQRALDHTGLWRCRLGEAALALGLVTPERLLTYLSRQLQVPFLHREALLQQVAAATGCTVRPVLALAEDIAFVLRHHGLGEAHVCLP